MSLAHGGRGDSGRGQAEPALRQGQDLLNRGPTGAAILPSLPSLWNSHAATPTPITPSLTPQKGTVQRVVAALLANPMGRDAGAGGGGGLGSVPGPGGAGEGDRGGKGEGEGLGGAKKWVAARSRGPGALRPPHCGQGRSGWSGG